MFSKTYVVDSLQPNSDVEDDCWPARVHCEMNIENWRAELKRFGLIKKYSYLLNGFENGFHQGIPDHSIIDMD